MIARDEADSVKAEADSTDDVMHVGPSDMRLVMRKMYARGRAAPPSECCGGI